MFFASSTPPIAVPANPAAFRAAAPAFADTAMFPDDSVEFWLQAAGLMVNQRVWRSSYGLAVLLFAEHNLALEAFNQLQADNGGVPGIARGVIAGEAAKSVSASYDTGSASEPDAGHWNLTVYGSRLIRLARLFGAGPMQLNVGAPNPLSGAFNAGVFGFDYGPGWRNVA